MGKTWVIRCVWMSPEVHAFRGEILDLEVEHLEPRYRRRFAILGALAVSTQHVDRGGHVVIAVLAVEADPLDSVVVVRDLQHTVLGIASLDAGIGVAGDGNSLVLRSVGDGQTVVLVVTLLKVAYVSGLDHFQAARLEVIPGRDRDGLCRRRRHQLRRAHVQGEAVLAKIPYLVEQSSDRFEILGPQFASSLLCIVSMFFCGRYWGGGVVLLLIFENNSYTAVRLEFQGLPT